MRALCAPDEFRGSLTAPQAARAIASGARRAGWEARKLPLADGGEGLLEVLGGSNRRTLVAGPLGQPTEAAWRLADGVATIEMAQASGLTLVGGVGGNDPVNQSSGDQLSDSAGRGVESGALCALSSEWAARQRPMVVGARVEVLKTWAPFRVPVRVACNVERGFSTPQACTGRRKARNLNRSEMLSERLRGLATRYRRELGFDVTRLRGGGAAGGLAGGLAALGAELVPGFELVAESVGLDAALSELRELHFLSWTDGQRRQSAWWPQPRVGSM